MTATLTAMVTAEHIVATHGALFIDSRLLAVRLKYDHETVLRSITRHKGRLEAKSSLRRIVGVKKRETRGATREVSYLLDERQCLILTGSLKKGREVDEWHDALVDAFVEARARIRELETQQQPAPRLAEALRERLLMNVQQVPDEYFTIGSVALRHFTVLAGLLGGLDVAAMPELSIAQLFARYARDVLHLPENHRRKYTHVLPNGQTVQAWAYDLRYFTTFEKWLWGVYFPEHFADYEHYRARRLGLALPAPAPRKWLAGPAIRATRPAVTQLPLLAETTVN